jgi:para-aminobenzoate synthetase component 1
VVELARGRDLPLPHRVARTLRESGARSVSLLESALDVDGLGRYSFVAAEPVARAVAEPGRSVRIRGPGTTDETRPGEPLERVRELLDELGSGARRELAHRARVPFAGGAVLALAYDLGRRYERWPERARPAEMPPPDVVANVYDAVLAWDLSGERVLYLGSPARGGLSLERARAAIERAGRLPRDRAPPPALELGELGDARSDFTEAGYRRAVSRVRRYIRDGDVFQVNLAQRFEAPRRASPDELYAWLRALSPAPFAAAVELGRGLHVLSSSPERFLSLSREGRVESWPIKGTRPRGATLARDERAARELLASEKDAAELAMIVDLARNDLGRVARAGSVQVRDARRLQSWPVVHHTVGVVGAELEPGLAWDALVRAAFPPASVTGAPKLRAIEIVDELEPVRRGLYTGALGWAGFDGALELCVLIRTIVVEGERVHAHAGGGVVLDSDPESERIETLAKARALLRVLQGRGESARG